MTHFRMNNGSWFPVRPDQHLASNRMAWYFGNSDEGRDTCFVPDTNIYETPDDFRIEMSVPGFSRESINIKLDNQVLTVSGKTAEQDTGKNDRMVRCEFRRPAFSRMFRLSEWVDGSSISARYENGILLITVPKREEIKPKPARDIEIG